MAATGLLGFNPYGKAQALDISSKPTQLAIQLQQKEQAKKEALDKYLMDYEKSINPAGMRKAESDIFLKKLADNKAFYIQNRDKILNPAKYGYDAQSQYMSNFKDMNNLIDQSKQAAANDKITTQHFIAQKNLNAPDGYVEAVEASHLPITDPRYRPLDVTQFKFWKSHDPFEFGKELKTLNTIPGKPELMKEGNYQYQRTPMEADINNLKSFSYNKLGDVGYVKMLQNLSNEEVGQLRNVYRQRMNAELPKGDAKELSLAYTLTNLPKDYTQTNMVEQPSFARAQQEGKSKRLIDYNNQNQAPTTHLFDILGSGKGLSSPNIDIKQGTARKKDGGLYSGNIVIPKEQLPSDFSAALSAAGISKNDIDATEYLTVNYKDGKAISVSSETLGVIDEKAMAKYQDALNKKVYGIKGQVQRITGGATPPAKKETTAEKMRKLANQNK